MYILIKMACNNPNYLPRPPRAWSRVQNRCALETADTNNTLVTVPYSNLQVPGSTIGRYLAMLNKGNVLQYKANSSSITQAQKYSKIAKGQWVNRNTTWATQSTRGYTNPNTTSLQRTGDYENIAIDPATGLILGPTTLPVTCPQFILPINNFIPINGGGGGINNPVIPPPPPPNPNPTNIIPVVPPLAPVQPLVIQNGGTLNCAVQENICTGFIKRHLSQVLCNPTTDSDVPGTIEELCWNDGNPTWYPRTRYTMTNSANKWPTNAYLRSAVYPFPPTIIASVTNDGLTVTLSWVQPPTQIAIFQYLIYQNRQFIKSVEGNLFTTEIVVENCKEYEYIIIGQTNTNVYSEMSNTVSITVIYIYPPSITNYTTNNSTVTFEWVDNDNCLPIDSYDIYLNDSLYTTVGIDTKTYTITGLLNCVTYSIYVKANSIERRSDPSNTITTTIGYQNELVLDSCVTNAPNQITLNWSYPSPFHNCCPIDGFNIYYTDGINSYVDTTPNPLAVSYIITNNLTNNTTYTCSVAYYCSSQVSPLSNSLSATPIDLFTTTNAYAQSYASNIYTIQFAQSGSITFNYSFTLNTTVILAGGGGGGNSAITSGGGGGGGGEVLYYNNISYPYTANNSYSISIGSGGAGGTGSFGGSSPGGVSSIFSYTAAGGGGTVTTSGGQGGGINGGTGGITDYPGNNGTVSGNSYGGGGGAGGSIISPSYYGGGGGGVAYDFVNGTPPPPSGGSGGGTIANLSLGGSYNGGNGGASFSNTNGNPGQYGGGGGGGQGPFGNGGNGGDGFCVLQIQYP